MAFHKITSQPAAGKFYVYVYRDARPGKECQPIYVGKGMASRRRADVHWRGQCLNPFFSKILEKIRSADLEPTIEIAGWFDDEAAAFDLERALIIQYGRRDKRAGTLTNLTDGGEGAAGFIPSESVRRASSARFKTTREKQWKDQEFRLKALANLELGRRMALQDEVIERKRVAAICAAKTSLAEDPDRSAAQSRQRSEMRKAAWQDPEIRERYVRSHSDPVRKAAKSASLKASWVKRRERNLPTQPRLATGQYRKREG